MLTIISPAKTLDYQRPLPTQEHTRPDFLDSSQQLVAQLRQLSPPQLSELMGISDQLAALNAARFAQWSPELQLPEARQALFAFKGDVYTGLDAGSLDLADIEFAQQHLRILSGLYGLLRPLDLMHPYRLEMGTRLAIGPHRNLYQFWGDRLTEAANQCLAAQPRKVLVNLASNEYFKSLNPRRLDGRIVTPEFRDLKDGQYKIISFHAKKARGLMTRYILQNRLQDPRDLEGFSTAGYAFNAASSSPEKLVFLRDSPRPES